MYFVHLYTQPISLLPSLEPLSSLVLCAYFRSAPVPLDLPMYIMIRSIEPSCSLRPSPEPTSFLHPTLNPRSSSTQPGAYELLPLEPGVPPQLSPSRPGAADFPPSKAWAAELPSTGHESLSSPSQPDPKSSLKPLYSGAASDHLELRHALESGAVELPLP